MLTALEVAYYILGEANIEKGDSITPLKLQKLVYYSQAWYYTFYDKPLFEEKIEAWAHGPVVRTVWNKYKKFATMNQAIDYSNITIPSTKIDDVYKSLIDDVIKVYAEHTGTYLEALTHSEPPWKIARGNKLPHQKSDAEITLHSMKEYYSTLLEDKK